MKHGIIGSKKMSLMPKWLEHVLNIGFVLLMFFFVFFTIWVFYVLLQVAHI